MNRPAFAAASAAPSAKPPAPRCGLASRASAYVVDGEADPLVPVAAGCHGVQQLPSAMFDLTPGMARDLPLQGLPWLAGDMA